jgi:hypothetical protein
MNYDEYIQKIGFRFYGPLSRLKGFRRLTNLAARFNVPFEIVNTQEARFINVGVWHGFTLLSGMTGNPDKLCIGVDNFSEFGGPQGTVHSTFQRTQAGHARFHQSQQE